MRIQWVNVHPDLNSVLFRHCDLCSLSSSQVSMKRSAEVDIVFLSGAASENPMIEERINRLTGDSTA